MASRIFTYGSLLLGALAGIASARPVVVESLDQPPAGWEEVASPASDKLIKLSIGLESGDHELLERALYQVSDPVHTNYGRHLSRESAKALLNPRKESTDAVKRWLSDSGIVADQVRDNGQWLHVRMTVGQAENLLTTRFGVFARDGENIVRTTEYSVPHGIRDHITAIQPTTFFHSLKKIRDIHSEPHDTTKRTSQELPRNNAVYVDLDTCQTATTPSCLRKLYKLPESNFPSAAKKALYAIPGFGGQSAQYAQLVEFQKRFDPIQKGRNFSVALVNGGINGQGQYPSAEANLDIQYAVSLAGNVPVQYLAVGGENHNFIEDLDLYDNQEAYIEPWLEFATYLLDLDDNKLPQVIAISYSDNEQHIPKPYAKQVCNMFGQLGARGVSVIVAAGNRGPGQGCMSNDGKNTTKFIPNWPPSCPYVTVVGATTNFGAEVAANFSSGGFSEYWTRPWWQELSVDSYLLKIGNQWKGLYNPRGRAYPDVAAFATNFQVINHDVLQPQDGTSAATPVFGSVIALINNERLKKGKPPMGFLNPWLYTVGSVGFKDITQGKSIGCPGTSLWGLPSPYVPNAGWKATKGWDPVTGLGTPLFDVLKRLAA